jgi:hypothetical protein
MDHAEIGDSIQNSLVMIQWPVFVNKMTRLRFHKTRKFFEELKYHRLICRPIIVLGNFIILYAFTKKERHTQKNLYETTLNFPPNVVTINGTQKGRVQCRIGYVTRNSLHINACFLSPVETIPTRRPRRNAQHLHSEGARFKFRTGHRQS